MAPSRGGVYAMTGSDIAFVSLPSGRKATIHKGLYGEPRLLVISGHTHAIGWGDPLDAADSRALREEMCRRWSAWVEERA